jgi:hypothetical protein
MHTATLEIKAFDTSVLTGVRPTGVLLDEIVSFVVV